MAAAGPLRYASSQAHALECGSTPSAPIEYRHLGKFYHYFTRLDDMPIFVAAPLYHWRHDSRRSLAGLLQNLMNAFEKCTAMPPRRLATGLLKAGAIAPGAEKALQRLYHLRLMASSMAN